MPQLSIARRGQGILAANPLSSRFRFAFSAAHKFFCAPHLWGRQAMPALIKLSSRPCLKQLTWQRKQPIYREPAESRRSCEIWQKNETVYPQRGISLAIGVQHTCGATRLAKNCMPFWNENPGLLREAFRRYGQKKDRSKYSHRPRHRSLWCNGRSVA